MPKQVLSDAQSMDNPDNHAAQPMARLIVEDDDRVVCAHCGEVWIPSSDDDLQAFCMAHLWCIEAE